MTASAEPSVEEAWIVDAFERFVLPIALHVSGREVLHASAVTFPSGVVGFCGYGGTGKSTTGYGLSRRGHLLVADDALAFTVDETSVELLPLPFAPRLVEDAAELFGLEVSERPAPRVGPLPLAGLVMLARDRRLRSGPRVTCLSPPQALGALVPHAYRWTSRDLERRRRMMTTYLDLVERVPVLSVRFRPGLQHLSPLLDELQRAVDDHMSAPR